MNITRRMLFSLVPGLAIATAVRHPESAPLKWPDVPIARCMRCGGALETLDRQLIPGHGRGCVKDITRLGTAPIHLVRQIPGFRYSRPFPSLGDFVFIKGWPRDYYIVTRVNQKSVDLAG